MPAPVHIAKDRSHSFADDEVDTSQLERFVGYNLRRAAAKQRERFRSAFDRYEIRPVQLTFLAMILSSMPIRQATLGKALDMKRANVVTVLDELIARGLVSREADANDRRSNVLSLTRKGATLTQELLARHDKLERDLARTFGDRELAKLVELLQAFRNVESHPDLD
jgi:DNA-binding MarR family transcriptional regulator